MIFHRPMACRLRLSFALNCLDSLSMIISDAISIPAAAKANAMIITENGDTHLFPIANPENQK